MLHDPARHEALLPLAWDEAPVRAMIERIVNDAEAHFLPGHGWPLHPLDTCWPLAATLRQSATAFWPS